LNFFFQPAQNPQCLGVSFKSPKFEHLIVQGGLAIMTKRRVSKVVRQARERDQITVNRF